MMEARLKRKTKMNHPNTLLTILLTILLTMLTASAHAGDVPAASDLTVAYTIPKVQVTHYSATPRGGRPCKYECGKNGCVGGKDESPSGVRPLSATIEKPGTIKGRNAVLTAVPQKGGSGGTFGCFFALPDAYPGTLFFAGDVYGRGSNGKLKTDVSSQCTPRVNQTKYSRMQVYNCKGIKGIPVGQQVQRDPPKRPVRPEPVVQPSAPAPLPTAQRQRPQRAPERAPASQDYDWAKWLWSNMSQGG